jgi:hypothetical protein
VRAQYFDLNDMSNPLNGGGFTDLREVFEGLHGKAPFLAELIGQSSKLLLGLGPDMGFVQFSSSDDEPPYLIAVSEAFAAAEGDVDFLIGGEIAPFPRRLCLPIAVVAEIVEAFLLTGERKTDISWEEI